MAMYSYRAVRRDGVVIKGNMEALHLPDLEARLERSGCDLIHAKSKGEGLRFLQKKITRRDLIDFFVYMEQMFLAGIPLTEALDDFVRTLEPSELKSVVESLADKIQSGQTLSGAMESMGPVFSDMVIQLVKVGETSGQLAEIFGEIKDGLKWQDELITQTKKLLMYPTFVGIVVFAVLCFMMIYLVPQMTSFIANMGGELPFHTILLMQVSDIFVNYWYVILFLPVVLYLVLKIFLAKSKNGRLLYDQMIIKVPGIGPVLKKIALARFASSFALLYRSGIGVLDALKITQGVLGNLYIAQELGYIRELVIEGNKISDAFSRTELFPPLVMRMINVGESTGALDQSLVNVSYFFNRDVKDSIDKIQSMIEPMMTVVLGLILGWVMLSVLGPIYDLISGLDI